MQIEEAPHSCAMKTIYEQVNIEVLIAFIVAGQLLREATSWEKAIMIKYSF